MKIKHLLCLCCIFFAAGISAQEIHIGDTKSYRPLVWEDFRGKPDKNSPYHAMTFYNIGFEFGKLDFRNDTAIFDYKVVIRLGEKSWVQAGKQTPELLNHEQGHFDMGVICARELHDALRTGIFLKSNYKDKLNKVYMDIQNKYHMMALEYDAETNHGANYDKQAGWDEYFKKALGR